MHADRSFCVLDHAGILSSLDGNSPPRQRLTTLTPCRATVFVDMVQLPLSPKKPPPPTTTRSTLYGVPLLPYGSSRGLLIRRAVLLPPHRDAIHYKSRTQPIVDIDVSFENAAEGNTSNLACIPITRLAVSPPLAPCSPRYILSDTPTLLPTR